MTNSPLLKVCLITASAFLSSCAYLQTHKNIEESFRQHTAYALSPDIELYKSGDGYYVALEKQQVKVHYPVLHDSVFLVQNNEPELIKASDDTTKAYRQISKGTAHVLQMPNGYAELSVLGDEIKSSKSEILTALPAGAKLCTTTAQIEGDTISWKEQRSVDEAPFAARLLSSADFLLIDCPGTLLYNISIPIMAPFVFFHEFLNEQ